MWQMAAIKFVNKSGYHNWLKVLKLITLVHFESQAHRPAIPGRWRVI